MDKFDKLLQNFDTSLIHQKDKRKNTPILIIDDDVSIRRGLKEALSNKYPVISAESGHEGVAKISEETHCVILDVKMHGLDGFQTYRLLKDKQPEVPIIFFTAFQSEHDLIDVINKFKPDGYVEKGQSVHLLENLIKNAVQKYSLILENSTYKKNLEQKILKLEQTQLQLQESNTALKVLLDIRERDRNELEENIVVNLKNLVFPYLDKLQTMSRNNGVGQIIELVKASLDEVSSPLTKTLSSKAFGLTPMEIKIIDLIKHGYTTKEIAASLNLAVKTIEFHRNNIRKKLGIKDKKVNLRAFLTEMQQN